MAGRRQARSADRQKTDAFLRDLPGTRTSEGRETERVPSVVGPVGIEELVVEIEQNRTRVARGNTTPGLQSEPEMRPLAEKSQKYCNSALLQLGEVRVQISYLSESFEESRGAVQTDGSR